jgi:single-stranded DNA-binding protein
MYGMHCACEGRVGSLDTRFTAAGAELVQLSVVVSESPRIEGLIAEGKREATWLRASIFADKLEVADRQRLRKGALVYLEGNLQLDRWNGQDAEPRCGLSMWANRLVPLGVAVRAMAGSEP